MGINGVGWSNKNRIVWLWKWVIEQDWGFGILDWGNSLDL